MVTQQLETFARQEILDALSALFISPEASDTLDRYEAALAAAAGLAVELGINPAPFEHGLGQTTGPDLNREYARLFLGTGPETVPISESVWTEPNGLTNGRAQFECRKAYLEAGLEISGILGIPEDHLGMQLGFAAVLLLKEDREGASRFFAEHPARWIPAFTQALRKREDADFFRRAADVLDAVCEIEALLLAHMPAAKPADAAR